MWPAPALVDTGEGGLADAHRLLPESRLVVVSDDANTITAMPPDDRGLWIGPVHGDLLMRGTACTLGPTAVRASLWCLLHQRTNALRHCA
jgi:hypothetical protein